MHNKPITYKQVQVVYVIWKLRNNIRHLHYYDNLYETITYKNTGIICNTKPHNNISNYIIMISWTWIFFLHFSLFIIQCLWLRVSVIGLGLVFPLLNWLLILFNWLLILFYINPSIWKDSWLMGKTTKQMC